MKRRGPGPEGVLRHQRGITNSDRQPGIGVRSPDAAVLDAERTTARARRNLGRVSFPLELKGDIAAVAFTGDEHVDIGESRAPQRSALPARAALARVRVDAALEFSAYALVTAKTHMRSTATIELEFDK